MGTRLKPSSHKKREVVASDADARLVRAIKNSERLSRAVDAIQFSSDARTDPDIFHFSFL
jgi:hypothetical protein